MNGISKNIALWLVIGIIAVLIFELSYNQKTVENKLIYSEFVSAVEADKVAEVVIADKVIHGKYKNNKPFETNILTNDPELLKTLKLHNLKITVKPDDEQSWWMNLLTNVMIPLILFSVIWIFFMRQMQGPGNKAMAFGKSKAKLHSEKQTKITFKDVAGADEPKQELQEIIEFLKEPKKFQKLGGRIPKGVLLFGPPGTGKTLLAKAVAGEANTPFYSISGSDFVEMFVGVGASRVRDLFEQGKKHAPCIIFIDEIDAVGRQRFAGVGGGHDEREQTLNQLLVEMDGFDGNEGVILIAATNRPDVLDPALMRPGRFDRHIVVDRPDLNGREGIINVHSRNIPLNPKVDVKVLARRTPGFSGADLANMINEGALLAARRNKTSVEMEDLEEGVERVMAGPERKSRVISEKEKKIVAYHEAGHALVAKKTPGADPIHKISIVPRGFAALGYTLQLPLEDRYLTTKTEITTQINVLLGGRVAEHLIFTEITTGAQNDIERATETAHKMVCEFGMSDALGPLTYGKKDKQVFLGRDMLKDKNYSEQTAVEIDKEVRNIIETCYNTAEKILIDNKSTLIKLAETLLEKEILDSDEVDAILKESIITSTI